MQIKPSMIDRELRAQGRIVQLLVPHFTKRIFRLSNYALQSSKGKTRTDLKYEQVYLTRADGSHLRMCIYSSPNTKDNLPGLLWFHGGGYAMGIPEQDEKTIQRFIETKACIVVAPDYRLSLDAPYPAALEDAYKAVRWMRDNADRYGIRSDQLMVGGNSAGGGLAAALCLYTRDKKDVTIAYQILIYPMLDDRMDWPSAKNNKAPLWNSKSNELAWKLYLGDLYGQDVIPYYAAPARCQDLSKLPPTSCYVGSLEPFRDEVVDYMTRLEKAGISTSYRVFSGCFHSFDLVNPKARSSRQAHAFLFNHFRYAVNNVFAEQAKSP